MKINYLVVGCCLFLLGMSGCSTDSTEDTDLISSEMILMAMYTSGPQTRADYTDTGSSMDFSWRNGDATSVVVDGVSGNENCQLTTSTDGKNVPFSGTVNTWSGTKNIYAFYPYSPTGYTVTSGDTPSTATVSLTLPNPQSYTVGGAISNSFMVGAGTATESGGAIDASVGLKQVMSIIKLNITNAPAKVTNVKLKCSESVFPTTATVKLIDGSISNPGTLVNELSMTVTDGTTVTDKSISFAMFPADLTGKTIGIEVVFEGGLTKTITKSGLSFARNAHYVMAFDATGAVDGIVLNGLTWAMGNLVADGPNGAKIGAPTDRGLYFQFGSLVGWDETTYSATSATIAVRPIGYTGGTSWNSNWAADPATENVSAGTGDPCKYYLGGHWRLPTSDEYSTLFNHAYSWGHSGDWSWSSSPAAAVHSSSGLTFLATGSRSYMYGQLKDVGSFGCYWSSSPFDAPHAFPLYFSSIDLQPNNYNYERSFGFPIRCVHN